MARTHVEFGSFFALLLGLGRPVRRLMGHHDAVAAVRRRGRLQEPVESLLLILVRAPAEPGMPELIVHVVRLPAGGLAGAGHLQTDEVAVVGDARVGSQRDEVVVPLALLELRTWAARTKPAATPLQVLPARERVSDAGQ